MDWLSVVEIITKTARRVSRKVEALLVKHIVSERVCIARLAMSVTVCSCTGPRVLSSCNRRPANSPVETKICTIADAMIVEIRGCVRSSGWKQRGMLTMSNVSDGVVICGSSRRSHMYS